MSLDRFGDMLRFGIHLKLSGKDEEMYYAQRLRHYIMEMEDFDCESENDVELDIYFQNSKTLRVKIIDSTLKFEPVDEFAYDGIMVVLGFISTMHDLVCEQFQNDQIEDEEILRKYQASLEKEENSEEEESDDWEWV
jgi:sulfite reductase alpha subunit-like flavoprotein